MLTHTDARYDALGRSDVIDSARHNRACEVLVRIKKRGKTLHNHHSCYLYRKLLAVISVMRALVPFCKILPNFEHEIVFFS